MKIQLDTTKKTIKLDESVKLSELVEKLEELLPNGKWKEFSLEQNAITEWTHPIIWKEYYPINWKEYYPIKPYWETPWFSKTTTSSQCELKSGTYNIQL